MNTQSLVRRVSCAAALCAVLVGSVASLGATERMTNGQWEFAMTTDAATRTTSQCISAEKAKEFNGDSRSGREQAEKEAKGRCTVTSFEIAGDVVSYSLACGDREMKSVTTFHGDSSEGSLVTTVGGKSTQTLIKARRLGACH